MRSITALRISTGETFFVRTSAASSVADNQHRSSLAIHDLLAGRMRGRRPRVPRAFVYRGDGPGVNVARPRRRNEDATGDGGPPDGETGPGSCPPEAGIEGVAQRVSEHVRSEHGEADGDSGKEHEP